MSSKVFLRGAAVTTALLAAGHILGSPWTPANESNARAVVAGMKGYQFDAMGLGRSYFDFYEGFGWMLGAYLIGHAILFWQLSWLATRSGTGLRRIS
jgi:hypothetical protein